VGSRRAKKVLTPEEKYDLWVRMLTTQITAAQAAAEVGVDRSTITSLRRRARDGAIAALSSKPGRPKASPEAAELAELRVEVERLGAVVIDQAIELALLRGKASWG